MDKQQKIDQLKSSIAGVESDIVRLETAVKSIDDKISEKIGADVNRYRIESDLGKREVDRVPVKDLLAARKIYKKELVSSRERLQRLKGRLKSLEDGSSFGSRHVLVRL